MPAEYRSISTSGINRREQLCKSLSKERAAELVESVKQCGLVAPPRVDAAGQALTNGTGLWAAQKAGFETTMALVEDREFTKAEILRMQLTEHIQHVALKPTEQGQGFVQLMELDQCSGVELAASLGLPNSSKVTTHQAILTLEQPILDLVDAGVIGISNAYELTHMPSEQRMSLLPQLQRGELTRDDLIAVRKSGDKVKAGVPAAMTRKVKVVLDDGRSVTVQAAELDMSCYIDTIRVLLRKAKRAQARGVPLEEFARPERKLKNTPCA